MKKILAIIALVVLTANLAIAQWQVPSGNVPIGRGPGVTGFSSVPNGIPLNFLSFGAVGDGVTSNDTAWTNFIAAIVSSCRPGYIPSGNYVLTTATVTVAATCNFHIYGDGPTSLLNRINNIGTAILAVTAGSPIIENIGCQYSNAVTTPGGGHECMRMQGTTGGKFRNVTVTGAFYVGLELRNDIGGTFEGNYITGAVNRGLFINTTTSGSSTKSSVLNNVVDGTNAVGNTNYCINVTVGVTGNTDNISVIGNRVINCQNQGIAMTAGGGLGNATITGNNVAGVVGSGGIGILVQVDNSVQPLGVSVSGNSVNNTAAAGIMISGELFGTVGNNSINNSPTGIQTQIVGATTTSRVAVNGNSIVNAASGIIDLQSSYQAFIGNSIQASAIGINFAGSDHCSAIGNNISIGSVGAVGINFAVSTSNVNACLARDNEITKLSGSATIGIQSDAGSSNISAELNKFNGLDTNTSIAGTNNNVLVQVIDGGTGASTAANARTGLGLGSGLSVTKTVRASGGASDCNLIFVNGILTGGSC